MKYINTQYQRIASALSIFTYETAYPSQYLQRTIYNKEKDKYSYRQAIRDAHCNYRMYDYDRKGQLVKVIRYE